ncbi:reverse transcriptase domain-containing protein [Tanacetum coccineum]
MDMPSPRTLKQMQSLNFRWTEAAEAAFLEMRKLVSELPTLTTLKKGETLMMYLAATNDAVSAMLLTERDGRQIPIHYVSQSLQEAETNYASIEKLALALVHAARRLRMYFQAHPIKVITNSPIGQVLNNSRASRRLYTDRASNNGGSKAGLILIAPDDVEYSYTLRLNFSNSNNDDEYEALLVGLWIAT